MSDFYAREIDTTKPSAARVYDLYLGGTHNYPVDRSFVKLAKQLCPFVPDMARHNRGFLRRAVQFTVGEGVSGSSSTSAPGCRRWATCTR